jgi:hypothetical protein
MDFYPLAAILSELRCLNHDPKSKTERLILNCLFLQKEKGSESGAGVGLSLGGE